jgi:methylmalonyl-CoA mutase
MSTADDSSPQPTSLLRDDFPSVEQAAWRREVDRLLKGAPFDKAMITTLAEGLRVQPLHTASDLADGLWGASLPGQAPFLRGVHSGAETGAMGPVPWLITQELLLADTGTFNQALLHDLECGQSVINLRLDVAGRRGLDPATAPAGQVGDGGTSVAAAADLRKALTGVDLAAVPLLLQAGAATLPLAAMLASLAAGGGGSTRDWRGAWGCDPVALASAGEAPVLTVDVMFDHAAVLTSWAAAAAPSLRTLAVSDAPWHEAGADGVLSLGLMLAGAIGTLREMEARGLEPAACAPRLAFHLSLDTDFFLEIARLRALRVLWSDVLKACGCPEAETAAFIHARTGDRLLSKLDPHTNLLRATTAAMAAVCGGADSLHVTPWDALTPAPGAAGRRLARNLQLILGHECRFGAVVDPAGGSWYVEKLTREVGEGAWAVMQRIETAGGLRAALRSGLVQTLVREAGDRRAARLARAQDARVGVNRFAAVPVAEVAVMAPEPSWLAERCAAAAAAPVPVVPLDPSADADVQMRMLVAAAGRGASLSALTAALGGRTNGPIAQPWAPLPARRDAEPFESLVAGVGRLAARSPQRARAHCLCLGDADRTGPRLDFARGALAVGGFPVTVGAFHQEAASAAAEARATGAAVVMLVGLDETYPELGAAVAALLTRMAPPPLLMAAGRPSASTEPLTRAGVTRFLHLGSDLVAEWNGVLDVLAAAGGGES